MEKVFTSERKVSGKPHPEGMEWKFNVTIDYTDTPMDQVYESAYAHDIVRLQNGTLRPSTAAELNAIVANGGYTIKAEDIAKGRKPADPMKAAERKFDSLSREEQLAYIAKLQEKAAQAK